MSVLVIIQSRLLRSKNSDAATDTCKKYVFNRIMFHRFAILLLNSLRN